MCLPFLLSFALFTSTPRPWSSPLTPPPHFLPPTPGVAFKKVALTPDDNSNIPMYPCIGLRTPGEEVEANFGSEPFVFDIASIIEVRSPWRA